MKSSITSFLKQITCVIVIFIAGSVFAQSEDPSVGVVGDNLSEELREIRTKQLEVASANGVQLNIVNNGMRYATGIKNIPPELRNETITHERDLVRIIPELIKYLGFRETESLEFYRTWDGAGTTFYQFQEFINDIRTSITMTVSVSNETFRVKNISGAPVVDTGFPQTPSISRSRAFNLVEQHIRDGNEPESKFSPESDFSAEVALRPTGEYFSLEPWWVINVPMARSDLPADFNQGTFYVSPQGEVENVIDADSI